MKITCPKCKRKLIIPQERLCREKDIQLKCPACQETIDKVPFATSSIEKICKNDLTFGAELKENVIKSVKGLPPMPHVVHKARQLMADPKMGFKELAKVLETDQAMTALILKLANSAYYGLRGKVSSIQEAATVLGIQTLNKMIVMVKSSKLLGNHLKGYQIDSGSLWRHSVAVAVGSELIAQIKRPYLSNDAFPASLLHDAGKLVLNRYVLERKDAFNAALHKKKNHSQAERYIFVFDHSDISAELCELWNIPKEQANAIVFHHCLSRQHEI